MARFLSFGGGKDSPKSDGQDFQCDCTVGNCSCSDWGPWVPKDRPIPDVVFCTDCSNGKHK